MNDFEQLFNPNVYSETAMPFVTAVCKLLDNTVFCDVSHEISECRNKYGTIYDSFCDSLNSEQKDFLQKFSPMPLEEAEKDAREHFNRGFRFGVLLMMEVLGEKALSN